MNQILLGAISMASLTVGLMMLKFWRSTRDRFFLYFAIAFALIGAVRLLVGLMPHLNDKEPLIYLLNLIAMLFIVYAIVDKNRKSGGKPPRGPSNHRRRLRRHG